jgi:hypothetical protein
LDHWSLPPPLDGLYASLMKEYEKARGEDTPSFLAAREAFYEATSDAIARMQGVNTKTHKITIVARAPRIDFAISEITGPPKKPKQKGFVIEAIPELKVRAPRKR